MAVDALAEKLGDMKINDEAEGQLNERKEGQTEEETKYDGGKIDWKWDYFYDYNQLSNKKIHLISKNGKNFNCNCKEFCFCFYSCNIPMIPNGGIYTITLLIDKLYPKSHENIIGITTTKYTNNGININNNKNEYKHAWQHELTDFIGWSPKHLFYGNMGGKKLSNIFHKNKFEYYSNNNNFKNSLPKINNGDIIKLTYNGYKNTLHFYRKSNKNDDECVDSYIINLPRNVSFYWFAGRVYGEMSITILDGYYYTNPVINEISISMPKKPLKNVSFEKESVIKKQYYNQIKSFSKVTENEIDNIITNENPNPHFVLTLNNLNDLNDLNDDNKQQDINNSDNEIKELKRLKNCIINGTNDPKIELLREKLGTVYNVNKNNIIITDIFYGTTNIGYIIWDFTKQKIKEIVRNVDTFLNKIKCTFKHFKDVILTQPIPDSIDNSYKIVKSYHVSCASKKPCNIWNCNLSEHNIGGVVLYMKDNKTDWYCNGRHCKIGYIIIKPSVEVRKSHPSNKGYVHGSTYKSVFNQEPDHTVVGSGFARVNGVWKWNSGTFNCSSDQWHGRDSTAGNNNNTPYKSMNKIEAEWIEKAVNQWYTTGKQNLQITDLDNLVIFTQDYL